MTFKMVTEGYWYNVTPAFCDLIEYDSEIATSFPDHSFFFINLSLDLAVATLNPFQCNMNHNSASPQSMDEFFLQLQLSCNA